MAGRAATRGAHVHDHGLILELQGVPDVLRYEAEKVLAFELRGTEVRDQFAEADRVQPTQHVMLFPRMHEPWSIRYVVMQRTCVPAVKRSTARGAAKAWRGRYDIIWPPDGAIGPLSYGAI